MKYLKVLMIAVTTVLAFGSANAQVRVNVGVGHRPVYHRPVRHVVVVHHRWHRPVHHVVVVHHRP